MHNKENIVTNETVASMLDRVLSGESSDALNDFQEIISSKISDALDIKKVEIASSLGAKDEDTE
jgi:hypothetical protein